MNDDVMAVLFRKYDVNCLALKIM